MVFWNRVSCGVGGDGGTAHATTNQVSRILSRRRPGYRRGIDGKQQMGAKTGRILGFAGIPIGVDTVGQIQLGCSAGNPYLAICDIGFCHQSCVDVPLGLVPGRREIPGAIGRSLPSLGVS
jgi:hypothetical protein